MSRRDPVIRLSHMLDYARDGVTLTQGRSRADLDTDRLYYLAMVRVVEVIGEAASRTGEETRQDNPTIDWSRIIGTRNRLIHGYEVVDLDILWDIPTNDLPRLITELERILPPLPEEQA